MKWTVASPPGGDACAPAAALFPEILVLVCEAVVMLRRVISEQPRIVRIARQADSADWAREMDGALAEGLPRSADAWRQGRSATV